ncbi:MAG: hypothetical protein U9R36_04135 [Elusimicrobiota bacterium]|nr:hypothetical protein [Elusimicrobiota bacterium]
MPFGDGTGPAGGGAGSGAPAGEGRGMMEGNKAGAGPGGECICPNCGTREVHSLGTPCYQLKCPKCGAALIRA